MIGIRSAVFMGMRRVVMAACLAVLCLGFGCATTSRGPKLIINTHVAYNRAVSQVLSEELLLNVVRRRYLEAPQFVTVDSITASINLTQNLGASASVDLSGGGSSVEPTYTYNPGSGLTVTGVQGNSSSGWSPISINSGVTFSDSPTVTFTPRQGEDIAGPLHTSMAPSILAEMANAGYRLDLLLLLLVQDINGVRSVEAGVGDSFRGGSKEFCELLKIAQSLSSQNELVVGSFKVEDPYNGEPFPAALITPELWLTAVATEARWRSYDEGEHYYLTDHKMYPAMWMSHEARVSEQGRRFMELLNLRPDPLKEIWVVKSNKTIAGPELVNRPDAPRDELKTHLRSFYGVMNLLAYGVQVPPKDDEDGLAFPPDSFVDAVEAGRFEDLRQYFNIRSLNRYPAGAYVAVPYRGNWFYIDDADLTSKRIFNALYDLFNLQVAPSGGDSGPVLTLPVN